MAPHHHVRPEHTTGVTGGDKTGQEFHELTVHHMLEAGAGDGMAWRGPLWRRRRPFAPICARARALQGGGGHVELEDERPCPYLAAMRVGLGEQAQDGNEINAVSVTATAAHAWEALLLPAGKRSSPRWTSLGTVDWVGQEPARADALDVCAEGKRQHTELFGNADSSAFT